MRADPSPPWKQPAFRLAYWFNGYPIQTLAAVCRRDSPKTEPWRKLAAQVCAGRVDAGRRLKVSELVVLTARQNGAAFDEDDAMRQGLAEYYARQIAAALGDLKAPHRASRCEVITDIAQYARGEAVELATWHEMRMTPALARLAALGVEIDLFGPPWPTEILLNGGAYGTRS